MVTTEYFLHRRTRDDAHVTMRLRESQSYSFSRSTQRRHLQTSTGVEDYMLLAESRYCIFWLYLSSRGNTANPLSEFTKTLPYSLRVEALGDDGGPEGEGDGE